MTDDHPTCCSGEDTSLCCPGVALRERLAEAWDEGAICRAQADPATTVRDLNPYRD